MPHARERDTKGDATRTATVPVDTQRPRPAATGAKVLTSWEHGRIRSAILLCTRLICYFFASLEAGTMCRLAKSASSSFRIGTRAYNEVNAVIFSIALKRSGSERRAGATL